MTLETGLRRRFESPPDALDGMPLRRGRVIAVNNPQRRVDVAMEQGEVIRDVPVLSGFAGTHVGTPFVGTVDNPAGTQSTGSGPYADMTPSLTNDVFAIVGYITGNLHQPYVLGFLFPEQFETSFKDIEVEKHANGMHMAWTVDGLEISHPSGFYIKVGTGVAKTVLNGANYDSRAVPFDDTKGTASAAPDVVFGHPSGFSLRITSTGSLILTKPGGASFDIGLHTHGVTTAPGTTGGPG